MNDMQQVHDEVVAEAPPEAPRKSSGYRRLQGRHRNLIAEFEALKSDYEGLQIEQEALQKDVGRLLEQHKRLMANARTPQAQPNWFEGASMVLAQLAANPDPQACKVMEATLVGLLQRAIGLGARLP